MIDKIIGIVIIFGVGIVVGMYITSQLKESIRSNINRNNLMKNLNEEKKTKQ